MPVQLFFLLPLFVSLNSSKMDRIEANKCKQTRENDRNVLKLKKELVAWK